MQEDLQEEFWYRRHNEVRRYVWISVISNLTFQIPALLKPSSQNHFYTNVGYTAANVTVSLLLIISYQRKKYSILALPAIFIQTLRLIVRLLDFEDTKPSMMCDLEESDGKMSVSEWGFLALMQSVVASVCLYMMLFSFANYRYNFVFLTVLSIFIIAFVKQIFNEKDAPFFQDSVHYLSTYGVIMAMIYVFFYFN